MSHSRRVGTLLLLLAFCSPAARAQDEGWITHRAALSPDLKTVVTGSMHAEKGTSWLIARDAARNEELLRVTFDSGPVRDISFSADSSLVAATANDGSLRIFRTRTLERLHEIKGHRGWVIAIALSADAKLVASAGRDDSLQLHEVETGKQLWRSEENGIPSVLLFLPDGTGFVAAHHQGPLNLWKTDGTKVTIATSIPSTLALALSADGKRLATAHRDGELRLWDLEKRELLWKQSALEKSAYCVAISPDGKQVAVAGGSGAIQIRNASDGSHAQSIATTISTLAVGFGKSSFAAADYYGSVQRFTREGEGEWQLVKD